MFFSRCVGGDGTSYRNYNNGPRVYAIVSNGGFYFIIMWKMHLTLKQIIDVSKDKIPESFVCALAIDIIQDFITFSKAGYSHVQG